MKTRSISVFGPDKVDRANYILAESAGCLLAAHGLMIHGAGCGDIVDSIARGAAAYNSGIKIIRHSVASAVKAKPQANIIEERVSLGSKNGDNFACMSRLMESDAFLIVGQMDMTVMATFGEFIYNSKGLWPQKKKLVFLCHDSKVDLEGFDFPAWCEKIDWFNQYIKITDCPKTAVGWLLDN